MHLDRKKVVVGMSGGVDSSVAAALLVEQGYDVIGITIKTYSYESVGGNVGNDSSCCSLDGINDARRVCMKLGIPHFVVDFSEPFKERVIDYFIDDYLDGNTPNPCVQCNRHIKWAELLKKANSLGAYWIATGHYAALRKDESTGRFTIERDVTNRKDQTYALWNVSQDSLSRTLFPLARYTKERSRADAERFNLGIASKPESYEICFIPDNDYKRFLRDNVEGLEASVGEGDIVLDGQVIGRHNGFYNYTVGQRKGLGVSFPEPLFVLNVSNESNVVEVGREVDLYSKGLIAHELNMMKYDTLDSPLLCTVKVRYKDDGAPAMCYTDSEGLLHVDFFESRKAITRGQSVVLYESDDVVGGGIILRAKE